MTKLKQGQASSTYSLQGVESSYKSVKDPSNRFLVWNRAPLSVHDKHISTISCNFAAGYQTQFLATPGASNKKRKNIIFYLFSFPRSSLHACFQARTHAHTHARTHTRTHTHTHTHTHARTHTLSHSLRHSLIIIVRLACLAIEKKRSVTAAQLHLRRNLGFSFSPFTLNTGAQIETFSRVGGSGGRDSASSRGVGWEG